MRNFLATVVLTLTALAASLLGMEWGTRVLVLQNLVRAYLVPDPDLGMAIGPNKRYLDTYLSDGAYEVRTNAAGMRMDEPADMSPSRLRVPVYGDSFTFGWGLDTEKNYFHALKRAAKKRAQRLQLLNAGVGGYGTGHIKILMSRHLPALKPAAVIYFFNCNDIVDNVVVDLDFRVSEMRNGDDGRLRLVDVRPFAPWKRFLLHYTPYGWQNQHSHLFVLAKQQLKRLLNWKTQVARPTIPDAPTAATVESPAGAPAPLQITPDAFDHTVLVSELHVRRLMAITAAAGIPMLIAWVPAPQEMAPPPHPTGKTVLFEQSHAMLARVAAERADVGFVDTVELLRAGDAAHARQPGFRLSDGHFSAAGAAWYAELAEAPVLAFLAGVVARAAPAK